MILIPKYSYKQVFFFKFWINQSKDTTDLIEKKKK